MLVGELSWFRADFRIGSGVGSKLVWELCLNWFRSWFTSCLGIGPELVWEFIQSSFGSGFKTGLGVGSELAWELVHIWFGECFIVFLELARSSFQKCHSWDLGSISRRKFMENENAER
jgi:hypothetical protein